MFTASDDHRKERVQNAANERLQLENGENARPGAANATSDAVEKLRKLRV